MKKYNLQYKRRKSLRKTYIQREDLIYNSNSFYSRIINSILIRTESQEIPELEKLISIKIKIRVTYNEI